MLNKLLKYDLKRSFSWLWILSLVTLVCAGITRLIGLGNGLFFTVLGGIFIGITTALVINVFIQPFLRIFISFTKDVFGDESYLTHTLPVTKNQFFASRLISATIQLSFAIIVVVLSFFILYYTPSSGADLINLISFAMANAVSGLQISAGGILTLLVLIVLLVVAAFSATCFTGIMLGNKCRNRKSLCSVLIAVAFMYAQNLIMGLVSLLMMIIFGADLSADVVPASAFIAFLVTYIVLNIIVIVVHNLVTKRMLNKGVNVD